MNTQYLQVTEMRLVFLCFLLFLSSAAIAEEEKCESPPVLIIGTEAKSATRFDTGGMKFLWMDTTSSPKKAVFVSKYYLDSAGARQQVFSNSTSAKGKMPFAVPAVDAAYNERLLAISEGWHPTLPGQAQVSVTFLANGKTNVTVADFVPGIGKDGSTFNEENHPGIRKEFCEQLVNSILIAVENNKRDFMKFNGSPPVFLHPNAPNTISLIFIADHQDLIRQEDLAWSNGLPTDEKTVRIFRLLGLLKSSGFEKCVSELKAELPDATRNVPIPKSSLSILADSEPLTANQLKVCDELSPYITMILRKYCASRKYYEAENALVGICFEIATLTPSPARRFEQNPVQQKKLVLYQEICSLLEQSGFKEESSKLRNNIPFLLQETESPNSSQPI